MRPSPRSLALVLIVLFEQASASAVLPESLRIHATSRDDSVSSSWLSDIATESAVAIERSSCFPASPLVATETDVAPIEPGALLLDIHVGALEESMRHEQSLVETVRPDDPAQGLRVSANVAIEAAWVLRRAADSDPLAEKDARVTLSYRPFVPGENASATARERAILKLAREIARSMCRRATLRRVASTRPSR